MAYTLKYDKYTIKASHSFLNYEFYSEGPNGRIIKRVQYKEFARYPGVFNLAFGDLDSNGEINDIAITDNRDSEKVLATVALTAMRFFEKFPDTWVYITGSTAARIRLYRMGISKNLAELQSDFNLLGLKGNEWRRFEKGTEYTAFIVSRKK